MGVTPPARPVGRTPVATGDKPSATKLTLGQRVLTALPRLQPRSTTANDTPGGQHGGGTPGPPAKTAATKTGAAKGTATKTGAAKGTVTKTGAAKGTATKTAAAKTGGTATGATRRTATATAATAGVDTQAATTDRTTRTSPSRGAAAGTSESGSPAGGAQATDPTLARGATTAPQPLGARLRAGLLKPAPTTPSASGKGGSRAPTKADPYPDKSSAELRTWIRTLDDRERLYTLIAAPLGAAVGIVGMIVSLQRNPAVGVKGHASPGSIALVGGVAVVLAVVALVSGLMRKRSFAAFSIMFLGFGASLAGGAFGSIPFLGLGLWLIFRSNKMQKALVSRGESIRQQRTRTSGGGSRGSGSAGARSSTAGSRGRAPRRRRGSEPVAPTPNKRYTPPKPKDDNDR